MTMSSPWANVIVSCMHKAVWALVVAVGCSSSANETSDRTDAATDVAAPKRCTVDCEARVIASGLQVADSLVVDGTAVYWTEFGAAPAIKSVARSGGEVKTIASVDAQVLALDATHVYCTTASGSVSRVAKSGGEPEMIGTSSGGPIAVDDTTVYWGSRERLYHAAKAGAVTPFRITTAGYVISIALDATHVYFATSTPERGVFRLPKVFDATATPERVLPAGGRLAVDDASIFFVVAAEDLSLSLSRAPKAGGEVSLLLPLKSEPGGVVVDSTHVYVVSKADGPIAIAKGGGEPTVVAPGLNASRSVASDDEYVYAADLDEKGAGRITRVGKK